jgi:hypothetical protein
LHVISTQARLSCFPWPLLILDAGTLESIKFDHISDAVEVSLSPAAPGTPPARLRLESLSGKRFRPAASYPLVRDVYSILLQTKPVVARLK